MNLTVKERLVLLSVLPPQGDFITLKVVRKLRETLSFTDEEIGCYKFVNNEERVTWDPSVEQEKEVPVSAQAEVIIRDALKKLNDEKKLTENHFTLYEKFMAKHE